MSPDLTFIVYGDPIPQGSSRAFVPKGWTRPIITTANPKTKPWRQEIAGVAQSAMVEASFPPILSGPVYVRYAFYFNKPNSLAKKASHKTTRPDLDKLARSVSDALTGIVFKDDCQIVDYELRKQFGSPARVEIKVGLVEFGAV